MYKRLICEKVLSLMGDMSCWEKVDNGYRNNDNGIVVTRKIHIEKRIPWDAEFTFFFIAINNGVIKVDHMDSHSEKFKERFLDFYIFFIARDIEEQKNAEKNAYLTGLNPQVSGQAFK